MSWLCDSTELVSGAWLSSAYAGHGVLGAAVPITGEHGPALLYPGLNLPTEGADEFRAVILTRPGGLTVLAFDEDSSWQAEGSPGSYVGTWEGFKNGVSYGTSTYTVNIGPSGSLAGSPTLDTIVVAGALGAETLLSGNATLEDLGASGIFGVEVTLTGSAALDSVTSSGNVEGGSTLTGTVALDSLTAVGSLTSTPNSTLSGASTLQDADASGALDSPAVISGTADTDSLVVSGSFGIAGDLNGAPVLASVTTSGSMVGFIAVYGASTIKMMVAADNTDMSVSSENRTMVVPADLV